MGLTGGLRIIAAAAFAAILSVSCQSETPPLRIFAAASTTEVVSELAVGFSEASGRKVETNFASSSTLAQQIDRGARSDLFLSANQEWVTYLEERGRTQANPNAALIKNTLVVVARTGRMKSLSFTKGTRPPAGRVAIGDPSHVPVGIYAKSALESVGWWGDVQRRTLPGLDVRATLAYVELGEADWGIVYATDAAASKKVEVVATVPETLHPPISYLLVVVEGAAPRAAELAEFLRGPEGRRRFEAAGFTWIERTR